MNQRMLMERVEAAGVLAARLDAVMVVHVSTRQTRGRDPDQTLNRPVTSPLHIHFQSGVLIAARW